LKPEKYLHTRQESRNLDLDDPLRKYRDEFHFSDEKLIYLDGNSLGRLPLKTSDRMTGVLTQEWGSRLIRSWNDQWYQQPSELGKKIARLIGAAPDEVIVSDSTSVNLYKLLHAAVQFQSPRAEIVSDTMNFPSDLYIIQGLIERLNGKATLNLVESADGVAVEQQDIAFQLNENTAVLTLSHVAFKSAFMYDMKSVTQLAHDHGALALWDLSHSVGAVPIDLHAANVDMAVGCTYKYLNGGPGAPAFIYVRKDLQEKLQSPIWGWFGNREPFRFEREFAPAAGIEKFLVGTPPVLAMSAIKEGLDIIGRAGIDQIRKKSLQLTEYLISLSDSLLTDIGCRIASPRNPHERGSHVAIAHPEAYRICNALISPDIGNFTVIPDFRAPDIIRLGLSPLTTSFEEVFLAVNELRQILLDKTFQQFSAKPSGVT
jgi:kynureninase